MKTLVPVLAFQLAIGVPVAVSAPPLEILTGHIAGGVVSPDPVYGWPRNERYPASDPGSGGAPDFGVLNLMDSERGSSMNHQLRCQEKYPTYEIATDTYLSGSGLPTRCRL